MRWSHPTGSTPLDPAEIDGLRIKGLTLQHELDIEEFLNIAEASFWLEGKVSKQPLEESFLAALHHEMFGRVWRWAGEYRKTEKNLGVSWPKIRESMQTHLGNVKAQIEANLDAMEVATFYHHGLVFIHPFPNGNGRWARMATEVLAKQLQLPSPSWQLVRPETHFEYRTKYIASLKKADAGDYLDLRSLIFGEVGK